MDFAFFGCLKADDRPHQHRFARAGAADDAQYFALADVEVEIFVDDLIAEAVLEPSHGDSDIALLDRLVDTRLFGGSFFFLSHQFHPSQVKKTAKKASITITRKIA